MWVRHINNDRQRRVSFVEQLERACLCRDYQVWSKLLLYQLNSHPG
jgi:hypothetical protein